eukprot:gnl/Hemi2/27967_TR9234_c0_g1_i2.p2 gnl/Hemi2/27967_TR9234_c0_g1~~gnl/Hemi2/27967_TR9234_c0_g1_i2.p2  ORF type:complete len:127 (-),score=58.01 gnl/Hemi2/27967_TR9234_c0_g1_i2:94-474(-)
MDILKKRLATLSSGGLVAIIGDEDTCTGFLLAGIGHTDVDRQKNFMIVDAHTNPASVAEAFVRFTSREDVGILLINQQVADLIRGQLDKFTNPLPAILEIPSKDKPYDRTKDSIMTRITRMFAPNR